jgi:hypothetical protein
LLQVKEFTTYGVLLREIQLSSDLVSPHHTVILTNGQMLVCHGFESDPSNRVCLVDTSSGLIMKSVCSVAASFGACAKLIQPTRLAVDETLAAAFIADFKNDRIVIVDLPSFECLSVIKVIGRHPCGMFIDAKSGALFVGSWETGQLSVYKIQTV